MKVQGTSRQESASSYRSSLAVTGLNQAITSAYDVRAARERVNNSNYGHEMAVAKVQRHLDDTHEFVQAQLLVTKAAIMEDVEKGALSAGDGLRELAALPTYFDETVTREELASGREARVNVVNALINAGDGEPALLVLGSGETLAFPGHTVITPGVVDNQAGITIDYANDDRPSEFLAFERITPRTSLKEVPESEVIAGRRAIGRLLRQDPILSGRMVGSTAHRDDAVFAGELRKTMQLLKRVAETNIDLVRYGFKPPAIDRLQRLWSNLTTLHDPLGDRFDLDDIVTAMRVTNGAEADNRLVAAFERMTSDFLDVIGRDGVQFTRYRARMLGIFEALDGPLVDEQNRQAVMRVVAERAVLATSGTHQV